MGNLKDNIKDNYWQFLRGIAIFFVVLSHCQGYIGRVSDGLRSYSPAVIWYCLEVNVISTAVAIFFFISGYWSAKSYLRNEDAWTFCVKRFKRLLVPYLVYTFLYIVFRVLLRETFTAGKLFQILALGQAATPLYYLPVLLAFSLLTPVFMRFAKHGVLIKLSVILSLILLFLAYFRVYSGHSSAWYYLRYTPVWLPFYAIGIGKALHDINQNDSSVLINGMGNHSKMVWSIVLVIVCFVIKCTETVVEAQIWNGALAGLMFSQLRLSALVFSVAIVLLVLRIRSDRCVWCKIGGGIPHLIVILGDYSFGIYFLHMFFVTLTGIILSHFFETLPFVTRYLQCMIALSGSLAACVTFKHFFGKKYSWIFGL